MKTFLHFQCLSMVNIKAACVMLTIGLGLVFFSNSETKTKKTWTINSNDIHACANHQETGLHPITTEEIQLLEEMFKSALPTNPIAEGCWFSDTDPEQIANSYDIISKAFNGASLIPGDGDTDGFVNQANERWVTTASGVSPDQGDCVTITWSIPPDGSFVVPGGILGLGGSVFTQQMDVIFGCPSADPDPQNHCWFPFLSNLFDQWSAETGITYIYEPNDDGLALAFPGGFIPGPAGQLGVRGDARLFAPSAGLGFFGGPLGINFFPPTGGEMLLDLVDFQFLWQNPAPTPFGLPLGQAALANTIQHELGHGLGLRHVCPTDNTKLMEPFISLGFFGIQPDDLLSAQRQYGDRLCGSDVIAVAHPTNSIAQENLSIDDENDVDLYAISGRRLDAITIDVTPTGTTYESGIQIIPFPPGTAIGCLPPGDPFYAPPFAAAQQVDLVVDLLDPSGAVIATSNVGPAGAVENGIVQFVLPATGNYVIRVSGSGEDAIQGYNISCALVSTPVPTMSQWGLMIFCLLILNLSVVFIRRQENVFA